MEGYITIENGISISQQRQLFEMTQGLMKALTEDEFIQIASVYKNVVDRLSEQAKKEGIEIWIRQC